MAGEQGQRSSGRRELEEAILPALFSKLDRAFPEFGWKRTKDGWVATNEEFTKSRWGARPDRVISNVAQGFFIHGTGQTHWLAYLNDGTFPRGTTWSRSVDDLARRAGVPRAPRHPGSPLDELWENLRGSLEGEHSTVGAAYLKNRGFDPSFADDFELGFISSRSTAIGNNKSLHARLLRAHLLTVPPDDLSRWDARVVGCWRDEKGRAAALWGRSVDSREPRYVVTGARPPLYGAHRLKGARRVVVVEGLLDALRLQTLGIAAVAVGGADVGEDALDCLERLGVEEAVVALDADAAGKLGRRRLTERLLRRAGTFTVSIVPTSAFGAAKDVDELARQGGLDAWRTAESARESWLSWRVDHDLADARTAADRVVALRALGTLCREALRAWPAEVGEATRRLAERTGIHLEFVELVVSGERER